MTMVSLRQLLDHAAEYGYGMPWLRATAAAPSALPATLLIARLGGRPTVLRE